jgi:hypothetical protein
MRWMWAVELNGMKTAAGLLVVLIGCVTPTTALLAQEATPPAPASVPTPTPAQPVSPKPATPSPDKDNTPQESPASPENSTPAPPKPDEATPEAPQPDPGSIDPNAGRPAPRIVEPVEGGENVEASVYLKDGRRMTGFLVSRTEKETILKIEGVNSPIDEALIDRVEIMPPVVERYKVLRAAIPDDDADRLVLLARWLLARKQYDLALAELKPVIEKRPELSEARQLRTLIEQQKIVDEASAAARAKRGNVPVGTPGANEGKPEFPTLSSDDINLMRVFQSDLDDPPKMVVPRELIDEIIRQHATSPLVPSTQEGREALYRKRPAQILRLLFELKARDLYGMVRVLDDPASMKRFRDDVWRGWVMNSCASNRCHGGQEAGRLWLLNARTNAEPTVYTNLMILHQFKLPDGTPLINYDKPAESPLLQMALRSEESKRPHPRVDSLTKGGERYRHIFSSPQDRKFQDTVEWIKSMYVPQGRDYPIKYTPPVPASARPVNTDRKKSDPGR